jgi:outer membrane murein-binding lipoprotein Lpp
MKLVLLACVSAAMASESRVTPIAKVLDLMNNLLTGCRKEKADEATQFATFDQWCKDQSTNKDGEIAAGKQGISKLTAEIEKAGVNIKGTDGRIKELEEDVARWTKDQKSAKTVRDMEKADFTATLTDYQESLEALAGAIDTLKKQDFTRAQAQLLQTTLLQVQSRRKSAPAMPAELQATLTSLTQESTSDSDSLADSMASSLADSTEALAENTADMENKAQVKQEPAGYEFQSGGVIDMLKSLQTQFGTEKTNLEKEELNAQNAYEAMMQQLTDNVSGANEELGRKDTLLTKTQQEEADKTGDLSSTNKELEEDSNYLKDTTEMCLLKRSDFDSRQKLRAEEIGALEKAISIIGGDAVKGAGDRNLPALLQLSNSRRGAVLTQLRGDPQSPTQGKLAVFLSERARALGSTLLLDVAQRVEADPFKKVKKMVKDLIVKLMEEATAEMEHKGWCDTELTTNKQTRDKKTEDVDSLSSDIEDLTATVAKLQQDSSSLSAEVKALDDAMIKATNIRMDTKATNQKTITEAKDAISAVTQALAVLKDFYAKSAEATAFVQARLTVPADDAPESFDKPYKGNQAEGGGVVGMLEVILSDFTRLDSETTASEAQELEEYKNYMFESARDRALLAGQIQQKEDKKSDKESALHSAKSDLKETQASLDKAIKYYEKLKPDCVDSGITYEERAARREAEIQSLQEAVQMLQSV